MPDGVGWGCPPEEVLMEFACGNPGLGELGILLVVEHLRTCPACQAQVGQHVAVTRWLEVRAHHEEFAAMLTAERVPGLEAAVARQAALERGAIADPAAGGMDGASPTWGAVARRAVMAGRAGATALAATFRVARGGARSLARTRAWVRACQSAGLRVARALDTALGVAGRLTRWRGARQWEAA